MNKDEAREARLEAAYEEFLASCNNHGLCACDVCTGYPSFQSFKAAAASVDRKAIVREFQRRASAELCPTPDGYVYHVLNKIAKEMEGKHET